MWAKKLTFTVIRRTQTIGQLFFSCRPSLHLTHCHVNVARIISRFFSIIHFVLGNPIGIDQTITSDVSCFSFFFFFPSCIFLFALLGDIVDNILLFPYHQRMGCKSHALPPLTWLNLLKSNYKLVCHQPCASYKFHLFVVFLFAVKIIQIFHD